MPSRKQRRRQAKARRHEYEYIYVDDEGNEVEVDQEQLEQRRNGKAAHSQQPARGRGGRVVQPPSWQRVGKRAAIFAPIMFVTVFVLAGDDLSIVGVIAQTLVLLAIFLPFSYFMDSLTYRAAQRRLNRDRR